MRAPRETLKSTLIALSACGLFLLLGGPGGAWVQLREMRRRLHQYEDDLEAFRRSLARQHGEKGRAIADERKSSELAEIERIRAANESPRRNGKGHDPINGVDLPDWAKATLAGWLNPQGRQ